VSRGGGRWSWGALAAALAGCGDPAPGVVFGHGSLTEAHLAGRTFGCGPDERVESQWAGTTALSAAQPGVSRRLRADVARVDFDLDVAPAVTGPGAGSITLTASARAEDNVCGTGCEGAGAYARFAWSVPVSLPPLAQGYAVRVAVHAEHGSSRGVDQFVGQCAIVTPWRPDIVVEAGDSVRDFDAPAGEATIRVECDRVMYTGFAYLGCYGTGSASPPEALGLDSWVTASMRVRVDVRARTP
jgi:hypothetical protein